MYRSKLLATAAVLVAALAGSLVAAPAGAAVGVAAGGPDAPSADGGPARLAPAPTGPQDTGLATAVPGPPVDGAAGLEAIIGDDNRTRVDPTTVFPVSAIVNIRGSDGTADFGCTGWLYGPSIVATAGHCVHPGSGADGGGGNGYYARESYEIVPGRNSGQRPFGTCSATQLMSVNGWTRDGNSEYDYGAIRLNCTFGSPPGRFNFWWQSATLTGTATTVSGYPCDRTFGEQWRHAGRTVLTTQTRRIFYDNDTFGCQSGSPVYQNRPAGSAFCTGWCVMAIHTGRTGDFNRGTRITESVFNNLRTWRG